MKIRATILVILLGLSALFGCHKDHDLVLSTPKIVNCSATATRTSVEISFKVDFKGEYNTTVDFATNSDMGDAASHPATKDDDRYKVTIEGLVPQTTYYYVVRVSNKFQLAETALDSLTTQSAILPSVTTKEVIAITSTSASCTAMVVDDGDAEVTSRGVCWSTSANPTLDDSHTSDGGGTGNYTSDITGLEPGTSYYVRAYATNKVGTSYGSLKTFTTALSYPLGAIDALFSVSDSQQVWFSQGNLQYKASTATWRFAVNQWNYFGSINSSISSTYNGWVDLFGWGTSGYNHGATCYVPWSISQITTDYYAYGQYTNNLYDETGKADWGYNSISNGGNMGNLWRTLTNEEWQYVLDFRNTVSGIRYAKAIVNNVKGVVLLPDDWSDSYYPLNSTNAAVASFNSNNINITQWETLEQHGAVFLPAAGSRYGTSVSNVGLYGNYWSSSSGNSSRAYGVSFNDGDFHTSSYLMIRSYGMSVRLVQNY